MKNITRNFTNQEIITLFVIAILSILVWFAGPLLLIGGQYLLAEPEKRFGIIMVLFLGWLLLSLIFSTPVPNKPATTTLTPEALKKLHGLQGRFDGAIAFLEKTFLNKNGQTINLSLLPWYLFIGPERSGKTSLLANSDISFILSKQFKPEALTSIPASEACDWWVTRDLVLVDIPSSYIHIREKNQNTPRASLHNILWYNLLNLIQNHHKQKSISGIVVALNLPEMLKQANSQQKKSIFIDIKHRIHELRDKFGKHVPCYFIITKCDYLPGFIEFFAENSSEELTQAWGITLPALNANEKIIDVVAQRFNALIKRLNKQLLWRLHQERNPVARSLIKDFPLQIERVKESMLQIVKAIGLSDLRINGIFFTSALQKEEESNATNTVTINQDTQHALQILQEQPSPSKAYFLRQLMTQGLLHKHDTRVASLAPDIPTWHRKAVYTGSAITLAVTATFLVYDYQLGAQHTYSLQNNLAQYQYYIQQGNQQGDQLTKTLPLLHTLQSAAQHADTPISRLLSYLAFYSHKSQRIADDVYAKALQTIVLPEVKSNLESYLQTPNEKNPARLYAVLKAYLMLNDPQHMQADFIANTLKQLLPTTITKQLADELSNHLNAALTSNATPIQLDDNLISQARSQLTNLSGVDLAYVILKSMANNNSDSPIKLGTDSAVFTSKNLANQIPNMFTSEGFKTILAGEIATAANEAVQGNWIIGNAITTTQDPGTLSEQLRSKYISNYIDIWESQLANIRLSSPKDLNELNNMLDKLTSDNSPLLQMLQTIQQNTAFDIIINASPKLQSLNGLLENANNNQDNLLYQLFFSFRELHGYVQNIVHTNDMGNAVFQAAKQHIQDPSQDPITRMNTLAQQSSEPMKTWLTSMSSRSWLLISRASARYVDHMWQKNIMSVYHAQIANRYPFAHNATEEVNLTDFTHFLGQQGLLTSFYQTYLKPFVEETRNDIHWRTVDNQPLPFKNDVLDQFQNAGKIQHVFFPNGDNKLYVQFTLQPTALESNAKSFNLTINGQQINYQKNDPLVARVVSWPGNTNTEHATRINFVTPTNQLITNTINGDWGWFRLVDKATQDMESKKEMTLTFEVNGHTAKYVLFTQGHINPFQGLNLEKLQLPETLV